MNREELYEMMDEKLGYAYVYEKGNGGKHTDYMFNMTPENIANFIGKHAYTADKVVLTDMCDRLIVESIYGGFIMNCPNQEFCRNIIFYLDPIQMGEVDPKEFTVVTREKMQALWDAEEASVMQAEFRML
ncbi:resolvase [Proteiniborus sp. MB09-C3]|uniref:resolvase n=1 Tax=Proteiniborus sp. MB09-C3 TaxID=3050072 RepID=UPI0025529FA7|nr:resolvase [Proteiniborus sp. MB09-C3]WIV13615.1 resolvase [Proteiniborus sp. MB09-C3]